MSLFALAPRVLLDSKWDQYAPANALGATAAAVMAVLLVSGVLRWHGYGREWVWAHLLVAIRSVATPPDCREAAHTAFAFDVPRPSSRDERFRRRLRHKAICSMPAVHAAIIAWIGRGVRPSETPSRDVEPSQLGSSTFGTI